MPPLPGEERLLTLYTDIHYYFSVPESRPVHDRFDKESYFYIYYDASQHRARIEVANGPGTPDQDSFHGALDHIHLRHSTAFPTRCTLAVDGAQLDFPPPPSADPFEWRLPSKDPHDEGNELFRLHTLDIYFWTLDDANQFLDTIATVSSPGQIDSDRPSFPAQLDNDPSSVVQQLEDLAVADPAYGDGQEQNPASLPVSVSIPTTQDFVGSTNLPPPPPVAPPTSVPSNLISTDDQHAPEEQGEQPASTAPLPYNPAAPAAPEPIQHREKTPPPVDAADGTGLAAAAAADYGITYTPPSQLPSEGGYAPPPPPPSSQTLPASLPSLTTSAGYTVPPPSAGLNQPTSSFSPAPPSAGLIQEPTSLFSPPPPPSAGLIQQPASSFSPPPSVAAPPHSHRSSPYLSQSPIVSPGPGPGPVPVPGTPSTPFTTTPGLGRSSTISYAPQSQSQPQPQPYPQDPNAHFPPSGHGIPFDPQMQMQLNPEPLPATPQLQPQPQPQYQHQHQHQYQYQYQQPASTPTPPLGNYPTHAYHQSLPSSGSGSAAVAAAGGGGEYDVHNQVYRPTQSEAASHRQKLAQKTMKRSGSSLGQRPRKLEDGASKVESGVNRFLKKLEKKI